MANTKPISIYPTSVELSPINELYERGLYLQAYRKAQGIGPLSAWRSREGLLWAGRLTANLGGQRRGAAYFKLARRLFPADVAACAYYANSLLERRGPLAAWEFFRTEPAAVKDRDEGEDIQYYLAVQVRTLAMLRDFPSAWALLREAESRGPDRRWLQVERCFLLEREDRYDEALACVMDLLAAHPAYRPAVQAAAHVLQLFDRDEEALLLLRRGTEALESPYLASQLAALEIELEHHAEALAALDRVETLAPFREKPMQTWLTASRCLAHYYLGDCDRAAALARGLDEPIYREFAKRLAARTGAEKRIRLEVGFVRQHHLTCGPATLAALSRYFGRPAAQLEVAASICYDGTPPHRIRRWLEEHGWVVREFTLAWSALQALIDRGVPFAVGTVEAESAHLQAVVGYDTLRRTLLIRDPFNYYAQNADYDRFIEAYQAWGPRCLAMVPQDRAGLLAGLDLPDADLYDLLYLLERSLAAHDRETAAATAGELAARAPDHPLALMGRTALAVYDDNTPLILALTEERLARFPNDGGLLLTKLSCLRELGRREERLALLAGLCKGKESKPVFWREYARELGRDYRYASEAERWLRRALRHEPANAETIYVYAGTLWESRRFTEALQLYRFAACLGATKEYLFHAFFQASRHLHRTEEALLLLAERAERLRSKSAAPLITLLNAYRELERDQEALDRLNAELARQPVHGELLLYAAGLHGAYGHSEAGRFLDEAAGRVPRKDWLHVAAELAAYRGDRRAAAAAWRDVLGLEPLAVEAHRALALLLAETESRAAALAHLERTCAAFPHHYGLQKLRLEWLQGGDPAAVIAAIRHLLALHPVDAWAWRELALNLAEAGEFTEARQAAEEALRLEPNESYSHSVRGRVALLARESDAARGSFRQAIRLSVDNVSAVHGLMEVCSTLAEKREALAFIKGELTRQTVFGDGLLVFRDTAAGVLDPEELLAVLNEARRERPDLWHAWSALVDQFLAMNRLEEAAETAERACEAFPLLPRAWLDRATAARARRDDRDELTALTRAHAISPSWGEAARRLAEFHERQGDLADARAVLERICAAAPLDAVNFGCLADLLWVLGLADEALAKLHHALRLNPDYPWAWEALRRFTRESGRPETAVALANDLVAQRPGHPEPLLILAETLLDLEETEAALDAVGKAISCAPRLVEAYDLKARILASAGRWEEALACCAPPVFPDVPAELRVRRARLLSRRGDAAGAVEILRALVAEQPDLAPAWYALLELCWEQDQYEEALVAARRLTLLRPHDALPNGYLGALLLRRGERAGAEEAFSRALALDPGYDYAAHSLFKLQLAEGDREGAERTLAVLSKRLGADAPEVLARTIGLAAARGERARAVDLFRRLCAHGKADRRTISEAAEAVGGRGWHAEAVAIAAGAMKAAGAPPAVGAVWAELAAAAEGRPSRRVVKDLARLGAPGREAVLVLIERTGDAFRDSPSVAGRRRYRRLLRRILRVHGAWLRSDTAGWGMTGYALLAQGDLRGTTRWLADWRSHPDAEGWMLWNLLVALFRSGRDAEAYEVARHRSRLGPPDEQQLACRLWAALEELLREDAAAAAGNLDGLAPEMLGKDQQIIFAAVAAVRAAVSAAPGAYRFTREDRAGLGNLLARYGNWITIRRMFWRAALLCARRSRRPWPLLWAARLCLIQQR